MRYNHTQIGYVMIGVSLLTLVPTLIIWLSAGPHPLLWLAWAFPPLFTSLFGSLNVRIDDDSLAIRFGLGLIRKTIPLEQISECQAVVNKIYYGWGIRYTPHGWLYNVSGTGAVQVRLANGKTIRVGSDQPEALCQALEQALPRPAQTS